VTPAFLIVLFLGSLVVSALAAIGVRVLQEFSHHELDEYCQKRQREALFGEIHDRHEEVAIGVQCLQVIAVVTLIMSMAWWWFGPGCKAVAADGAGSCGVISLIVAHLIGALLLVVTTVWLPDAVAQVGAAPFLFHTWKLWVVASYVFYPLAQGSQAAHAFLRRLAGCTDDEESEEEAFEDEIRSIATEGLRDGLLEADAFEMIEGVMKLNEVDVADVMTPRSKIDAIDIHVPWIDVLKFVMEVGRTRIPVYNKSFDRVIGILYVKDLLPELARPDRQHRPLREILRPPTFVPKSKAVDDLLQEFQRTHNHIAVVLDEYQAVAGLITIEDVLEEIVGEIIDEHDQEEEDRGEIRKIDEQTADVAGHAHLDDINEELGLELPEDDEVEVDTISGLVVSQLGHIPKRGEQIEVGNVKVIVTEVTRRRIERVRIERE